MKVKTKEDVKKILEEHLIKSGELGDFEIIIDVINVEEIMGELSGHTAFKLGHDNKTIGTGLIEYGNINYEVTLEGDVLKGKCFASAPTVKVKHLAVK